MEQIWLSNHDETASPGFAGGVGRDIGDLPVSTADHTGSLLYLIDVHYQSKQYPKRQQQGGLAIYRRLLNLYTNCQEKLKVVFYSPIPCATLIRLQPANHILQFLPFIECSYQTGQFENALAETIRRYDQTGWPYFNNASENLLGGWALYKAQLAKEKASGQPVTETDYVATILRGADQPAKRHIVFIDDQVNEWENVYRTLLEDGHDPASGYSYLKYDKQQMSAGDFHINKLSKSAKIEEADLIVSDFYLEENHQPGHWMGPDQLKNISGFQLFKKIKGKSGEKGLNRGACYLMHSSSNKIPYFRILNANGIDNWLVKDTRPAVSNYEKLENYLSFKHTIEEYTSKDEEGLFKYLKNLWKRIEKLEYKQGASWWDDNRETTLLLLKSAFFLFWQYANQRKLYLQESGVSDINFTPAAVLSSLGKLNEALGVEKIDAKESNSFQRFFPGLRNAGSHFPELDQITAKDPIIFFYAWLDALNAGSKKAAFSDTSILGPSPFMIMDTSGKDRVTYKYRLLYVYLQFYNSPYSLAHDFIRKMMAARAVELLAKADKVLLLKEVLSHQPKDDYNNVRADWMRLRQLIAVPNFHQASPQNTFYLAADPRDKNKMLIHFT